MQCSNCGFETDTSFCPMCGKKIETLTESSVPTYTSTQNHYNPYAASSPLPYTYPPQQNTAPQPEFTPVPPAPQPSAPRKGGKAAAIIIGSIVGAIIIAGAVVMSFSALNGKSVDDALSNSINLLSSYYPDDYIVTDEAEYGLNQSVVTRFGTISLASVEKADYNNAEDYNEFDIYKVTFDVKNTLEEQLYVSTYDFWACDEESEEYIEEAYELLDKTDYYIDKGKSAEVCLFYAVPKDVTSVNIEYNYYNYDIDLYDYYYTFSVDVDHK